MGLLGGSKSCHLPSASGMSADSAAGKLLGAAPTPGRKDCPALTVLMILGSVACADRTSPEPAAGQSCALYSIVHAEVILFLVSELTSTKIPQTPS